MSRPLGGSAVWGILSTFNYVQKARQDHRHVFVQATIAITTYGNTLGNCLSKIEDQRDHRAVTGSNLTFELPGEKRLYPMGSGVPGMGDTRMPAGLSDCKA